VIYLDYQATTPIDKKVAAVMMPYFTEHYGNPHSNEHVSGWHAAQAVEDGRHQVSDLINADEDEIIFTSGATESNNIAILGLLKKSGINYLAVSEIEHKSILECSKHMADKGLTVDFLPVDNHGEISSDRLLQSIQGKRALVSIIGTNNEIGTTQNIEKIAEVAHSHNALFHVDAAQMPQAKDIDVKSMGIDLLSLSSHKIYGPKGIGALFINRDIQNLVTPIFHGGAQENGIRPGTLPVPLIVGFGVAASILCEKGIDDRQHMKYLSGLLLEKLSTGIPSIRLNGPPLEGRHPGNINVHFPGTNAKTLLEMLQPAIAASTGSACSSGISEPSYVLRSIGLSKQEAEESIRFSLGRFTDEPEIIQAVKLILEKIRKLNA